MKKVRLSDVIVRANTKVDKDNTDLLYYVGGEHFESGNLMVEQKGLIAGSTIGPMFYYGFKAGQFLLVSRNPHLRKAGIVDFDGICSEKTFVLQTADESVLLQSYLPFILQNDRFWEYAISNKHGSTNFFINWSTLANYEFFLPSIEEQQRISTLAWAAYSLKSKYKRLLSATDELVKSQFIEMFGDPIQNPMKWPTLTLNQACTRLTDGTHFSPESFPTGKYKYITAKNIKADGFDFDNLTYVSEDIHRSIFERCNPEYGDILYIKDGATTGVAMINTLKEEFTMLSSVALLKYNRTILTGQYLKALLNYPTFYEQMRGNMGGAAITRLTVKKLCETIITLPPLSTQQQFTEFANQSEKSKFELKQSIENIDNLIKSLIQQDNL